MTLRHHENLTRNKKIKCLFANLDLELLIFGHSLSFIIRQKRRETWRHIH